MKPLKLGTQLNISFALALFMPLIVATVFSIIYYSQKIREEALRGIASDLKIAELIYANNLSEMQELARSYSQERFLTILLPLDVGEKIGTEFAQKAPQDNLDMITVIDKSYKVLVRSQAPKEINDVIPPKAYIDQAFEGKILSGTEVLDAEAIKTEHYPLNSPELGSETSKLYTIMGVAPIYDRPNENIIAVIVIRRILNNRTKIVDTIQTILNVSTALFEHTQLISASREIHDRGFISVPSVGVLEEVLKTGQRLQVAEIQSGGNITMYLPVSDFDGNTVGILMIQKGVAEYVHTRNTAVITLLIIGLTGFVLAFSIKTVIERRILIPIKRLKEGTELIAGGNYSHQIEVTSGDEIGELTQSFNQMATDLNLYYDQLKNYNIQLEERVEQRTAELQQLNRRLSKINMTLEDTLEILNPGVSRLIAKNEQQIGLVYATEMVVDVTNYTKLNMILGEAMMGDLMKEFFRESHKLLVEYFGMLDKAAGDQIVVIFGIPKDYSPASPYHPFDAVQCALKLRKAAADINRSMQAAIQDNYTAIVARHMSLSSEDRKTVRIEDLKFNIRIGINTSNPHSDREIDRLRMVMMGAETSVDYTAQGGAVIYAFRLESSGTPGEIHIGENTKRQIEHVFLCEEIPSIVLKGLGIQPRYKIGGYHTIFDSIYPRTLFHQVYSNDIPELLVYLIHTTKIGKIQFREIRKIQEYVDVDIEYLEHIAGVYNQAFARALLSYAVAEQLELPKEKQTAILFASLWHNACMLKDCITQPFELYPFHDQTDDNRVDSDLVELILNGLSKTKLSSPESQIIAMCNQFDQMVFDRTYLKQRRQEILSPKIVISLMTEEGRYDEFLLRTLADLTIPSDKTTDLFTEVRAKTPIYLSEDPEQIASVLERYLTPEQCDHLICRLRQGNEQSPS